jgi:hypothetical protein
MSRRPLVIECIVGLFNLSFLYAALAFAFWHGNLFTGAAWLITWFTSLAFLVAHRLERQAAVPCVDARRAEDPASLALLKAAAFGMLAAAVVSVVLALAWKEGLDETSFWMTAIASLMAAKWAWLAHRVVARIQDPYPDFQAPLVGEA